MFEYNKGMENLYTIINHVMWVNLLMFIWFNTDAFCDYFFWVEKFRITEYKNYLKLNSRISYPEYLFVTNSGFFTKLISCKPCLLFWFTIVTSMVFDFSYFSVVYIMSYVIYRLLSKYIY